ncbi:MAG: hypothetical protein C0601_12280 [Candidatus Muiribacterium halophilum]|uniref:STAS domain-containing protein n=1 Tax=Muiribacterium halophilum TaxID=2053465 RepID=A0A2N5ZAQ2_MUIH1|nr:MAG: hypothetical protein C0601_12280 [Candidatus Muirbacterium halophilum]
MKFTTDKLKNSTVVRIDGNIKYDDIQDFVDIVNDLLRQREKNIIFDLARMPYINSAVIGQFISVIKDISSSGGKVVFIGVRPYIQNIFEISGLMEVFIIKHDIIEAVRYISGK